MATEPKDGSFEESIERLESIVAELESEETPLDRALELFKEGTALSKRCKAMLERAQEQINKALAEEDGGPLEEEDVLEIEGGAGRRADDEIPF